MLTVAGKYALLLLALTLTSAARAAPLSGPDVGVTPLGMGRAYSAIADDSLSLYYNPAGLAQVNRVDFQVFDVRLESNSDVLKSYSDIKGIKTNSQSSLAGSIGTLAGRNIQADVQEVTQITVPHFAIAFVYDNQVDFELQNLSYPTTTATYIKDTSVVLGTGWGFGPHHELRLGGSVRWINRTGTTQSITISQIMGSTQSVKDLFSQTGAGIGGDLGMQYRLPTSSRIETVGSLVWHDIGDTSFGTPGATNAPSRIQQDLVAGAAIRFPIGGRRNRRAERRYGLERSANSFSLVFDYDHLNTSVRQEALAKHLHAGANLDLPVLSFQLGINQSALTFGTSFDLGVIRVALATYGEELGSYASQRVDRRYVLSLGSDFGFSAKQGK